MTVPATVFKDRWIWVVDKPFGLAAQRTARGEDGVLEVLRKQDPRVALHHRLDRTASGLMVLGLNPRANKGLARGFREHTIEREYEAIVDGRMADRVQDSPVDGKASRTHFECLTQAEGMTRLRCRLETGRKHQIRVHASVLGHPILGDRRYGGDVGRAWPRLALHASRLAFEHPVTSEDLTFTSEVPADLSKLWALMDSS